MSVWKGDCLLAQAKLGGEPQKIIFALLLILEQVTKVIIEVLWAFLSEIIGNERSVLLLLELGTSCGVIWCHCFPT